MGYLRASTVLSYLLIVCLCAVFFSSRLSSNLGNTKFTDITSSEKICFAATERYDEIFRTCSYGELGRNTMASCATNLDCSSDGICFFGKCFCKPGKGGLKCSRNYGPVLNCRITGRSYVEKFDDCLRNPEYGSGIIPKRRWEAAQQAEAELWRKTSSKSEWNAETGDRAEMHVRQFNFYKSLPSGNLGKIIEIGSGQWTQTLFMLKARSDLTANGITLVDPGISGYIASGNAVYKDGQLNGVPVTLLSMGAEEIPSSHYGKHDVVVMINCIEHTFNAFATLTIAYRLLKPNGIFIFQERSVRYDAADQMFHPVRLSIQFFKWFLDMLYTEIHQFEDVTHEMGRKEWIEGEVYFIGKKKV